MKETARAIIRYPFESKGCIYNSILTVLDRIAVKEGKEAVYALPGGTVEKNEKPEEALSREIREELGLKFKYISKLGRTGRHNIFLVGGVEGVVDQRTIQSSEVLGVGFLNCGRSAMIPYTRLQGHLRHVVHELLGKERGLETNWPKGKNPGFKVRGYFFTRNNNRKFYDWRQQLHVNKHKLSFDGDGW